MGSRGPKPGCAKPPGAGRKKGTPNKDKQTLRDKARQLGVDPFEILLLFASGDWERLGYEEKTRTQFSKDGASYEVDQISPELRKSSAADACSYIHPKLKAIEHSEKDPGVIPRVIVYTTEWGSTNEASAEDPDKSP